MVYIYSGMEGTQVFKAIARHTKQTGSVSPCVQYVQPIVSEIHKVKLNIQQRI